MHGSWQICKTFPAIRFLFIIINRTTCQSQYEQGIVGVASTGPGYYVIALADTTVQQGALTGRLQSLGSHVREAVSQLS